MIKNIKELRTELAVTTDWHPLLSLINDSFQKSCMEMIIDPTVGGVGYKTEEMKNLLKEKNKKNIRWKNRYQAALNRRPKEVISIEEISGKPVLEQQHIRAKRIALLVIDYLDSEGIFPGNPTIKAQGKRNLPKISIDVEGE